jgi:hypothetical protein
LLPSEGTAKCNWPVSEFPVIRALWIIQYRIFAAFTAIWNDNIKIDLNETAWTDVDWFYLAKDVVVSNIVINLFVP